MMPSRFSWIALGLGAYLAFAISMFPARLAYRWFAPDSVRLAGVDGTVWSGSAAIGSAGNIGFHDLEWRLQPWRLLLARAGGQLQARFADGFLTTDVEAGLSQVALSNLQATSSLAGLQDLLPLGGIEGIVSANFTSLRIENDWPIEANGEVRVGELAVPPLMPPGAALIDLGNFRIRFSASEPPDLLGAFEDQGGPLEVSGVVRLSPNRSYVIEGTARSRPEAAEALRQGLEIMTAPPDAEGLRAFNLSGSL
ncbi:MAG: type II secretion system protein N [Gammaproteobacteria bacterium]